MKKSNNFKTKTSVCCVTAQIVTSIRKNDNTKTTTLSAMLMLIMEDRKKKPRFGEKRN